MLLRSKLHVTSENKNRFLCLTRYGCNYVCHRNKVWVPQTAGKIYGRFSRCPVRTESFRPDPESIRPESEVDSPDINYALCFSTGGAFSDSRCFVPVDGSLLSRHLDSSTSLHIDQRDLLDNELCCNSIIHPSIDQKKILNLT